MSLCDKKGPDFERGKRQIKAASPVAQALCEFVLRNNLLFTVAAAHSECTGCAAQSLYGDFSRYIQSTAPDTVPFEARCLLFKTQVSAASTSAFTAALRQFLQDLEAGLFKCSRSSESPAMTPPLSTLIQVVAGVAGSDVSPTHNVEVLVILLLQYFVVCIIALLL